MPDRLATLPPDWLLGAALLVFLLLILLLLRLRQRAREQDGRLAWIAGSLADLQQETLALKARLDQIQTQPAPATTLDQQIHAEALRLAREGADSREIADQLGISRAETELIIALRKAAS